MCCLPRRRPGRVLVAVAAVAALASCEGGREPDVGPPVAPPAPAPPTPDRLDLPPTPTPPPPPPPSTARRPAASPVDPCDDPVAGRWHARRWITGEWIEHRVTLTRQGGRLACAQEFRAWFGDRNATVPPRCPDGGFSYYRVLLDCDAQQRGDALEVRSATVRDLRHTCGGNLSRYNLDHLTGTVDGNQWDATNNDGADDIDARYRFVRLSCEP